MTKQSKETAVFIDGAWLYTASKLITWRIDYGKFFNVLLKIFGNKVKVYFFGISPETKQQEKFYISLAKIGYTTYFTQAKKVGNRLISSSVDVNLAVKAMSILPRIKRFVLISGDSDFISLLQQANNMGIDVLLVALPFSIGYALRRVVGAFLNLETLIREQEDIKIKFKKGKKKKIIASSNLFKDLYIEKGNSYKFYNYFKKLLKSANNSIIIIDSYINDELLSIISLLRKNISITLFTEESRLEPSDFCTQARKLRRDGYNIKIINTKVFHDRFIKIDSKWLHSGYSFKNLGQKISTIHKITDKNTINRLEISIIKEGQDSQEICK